MPLPPTSGVMAKKIKNGLRQRIEGPEHSLQKNSTDGLDQCHNIRYDRLRINRIRRLRRYRIRVRRIVRLRLCRRMDGLVRGRGQDLYEDLLLYVDHGIMRGIVMRMVGLSLLFRNLLGLVAEICGREVLGLIKNKNYSWLEEVGERKTFGELFDGGLELLQNLVFKGWFALWLRN